MLRFRSVFRHLAKIALGTFSVVLALALVWAAGRARHSKRTSGQDQSANRSLPGILKAPTKVADTAVRAKLIEAYGNLPLAFEPNLGQTNGEVQFLSRGSGYTLFLTSGEAVLALRSQQSSGVSCPLQKATDHGQLTADALRLKLVGANRAARMTGLEELPSKSNYFIGNEPAKWHTNVPNYRKVAARGVYPGIDLVYYGNQRQLEHDFVVAPGADPRAIRLAVDGARKLETDSQGDLIIQVEGSEVSLRKPAVYQKAGGIEQAVDGHYVIEGNHEVAFRVGNYNSSLPLVIDPILSYSTYLGGSDIDSANAIAVAGDGTAFIAGGTFSIDFPTAHSLQPTAGGPRDFPKDAFVSKISADGSALLYSTYLGGEERDEANGIAVDAFGNAYVVGTTLSTFYPGTPGAWDPNCSSDGQCGGTLPGRGGA
ncbi:MAG: hypothetical protein DMG24_17265, partial [Acidobacteria bacterium]